MELGRIKDQLDAVLDRMEETDPASEDYEVLTKRADSLRKIIQDEERARETGMIEAHKVATDLEERRKDRITKILLGIGAGFLGFASIFADETRVVCRTGLETVDKVRRIIH